MEIINQHTKKIMEECKLRAKDAGLKFDSETLEYIVTNKDMLDLSPKVMIPTLYDYWVNDVEVLKGQGKYKLYPSNPYETVINSRPAISFYNDNNPDWMNIMIFYHVIGHIDFFQNNKLFEHTWNDDFVGQALADKRLIANLRLTYGRWVDYIIEFSRSIDNLVGYFPHLAKLQYKGEMNPPSKVDFYFDKFLQKEISVSYIEYFKEVDRYNNEITNSPENGENIFFSNIRAKYPEFNSLYETFLNEDDDDSIDLLEFINRNSPLLNKRDNQWMKSVLSIIRNTSMYFQPQIRTKIANEGWASYWHDNLFRKDPRIKGHESGYAKLNAGVTSISRVGLNPYAIGLRLFEYVEDQANKGKLSREFQLLNDVQQREDYNKNCNTGKDLIFKIRENFSDFMFVNTFVSQDFVDYYNLFVVGQRYNQQRQTIEYYIKSRKAQDYKNMLIDSLYHPPLISVNKEKTNEDNLYLEHKFEHKQLVKDFIPDTLLGIEFLWGGQVQIETTEITVNKQSKNENPFEYKKVLYTIKDKKVTKQNL